MYLSICIFDEEHKAVTGYCASSVPAIYTFNVFVTNSLLAEGLRYRFTCICVHQMRNS